jgi:hypothetical protein
MSPLSSLVLLTTLWSTATVARADEGAAITAGHTPVIAYLDVHCGHCAQTVDWITRQHGLPDVAWRVVFVSRSPGDRELAEHVLCAPARLRPVALQQAFARRPDTEWLRCARGHAEAIAHEGIAASHGVTATPVFAVSGQTVRGFDPVRLASLVKRQGK